MPLIDPSLLAAPLPGADPYGPDLEQTADDEFIGFFNDANFALPETFFGEDGPFNPATSKEFQQYAQEAPERLEGLLKRSCDLRLHVFLAKLAMLKRNASEAAAILAAISELLAAHWEGVHPREVEGSYFSRARALEDLARPVVAFSLQFTPLCRDRRRGDVSLRSKIAPQREGDLPLTDSQIVDALRAADAEEIGAKRADFESCAAALDRIRGVFLERTAGQEAPDFGKLGQNLSDILKLFALAFPREGETPADGASLAAAGGAAAGSRICRAADARAAIERAIDYFVRKEPSNPALPLVAQAKELFGKTFIEALDALVPGFASQAAFAIGEQASFPLNVSNLASATPSCEAYFAEADEPRTAAADSFCSAQNSYPPQEIAPEPDSEPAAKERDSMEAGDAASIGESEAGPAAKENEEPAPETDSPRDAPEASPPRDDREPALGVEARAEFTADTRAQTLALLHEVASYLRSAEPSSAIPWLIERACALAEKDFLAILSDVLPPHALERRQLE